VDVKELISRIQLFAGLEDAVLERVSKRFRRVSFAADEVICREGATGDRLFLIVRGLVSVTKQMGWGPRELGRFGAGEVVGEMALISEESRSASVTALESTECLELKKRDFVDLLDSEPHFAQQAARILTERLSVRNRSSGRELLNAHRALIFALANLADSRDPETGAHLNRTRRYCALLAEHLAAHPKFRADIDTSFIEGIFHVSPLHDIGKVAIPDAILLKPGRLTDEEFEAMKRHSEIGANSLERVLDFSGDEIFRMAYRICLHHHERWDGGGYPEGLAGDAISIEARIMAMADVYGALLSKRVYKPPISYEAARKEIADSRGTHFDPELTDVMLANIDAFEDVHRQYVDP
jgi:response regulator RpfG family c-di-GMP phosphodiesterase